MNLITLIKIPANPDRIAVARSLLYLLAFFGLIVIAVDARAGNWPVVGMAVICVVLTPIVIYISRVVKIPALPSYFAVALMVAFFYVGSLTQLHRQENILWNVCFPFTWFYLAGLHVGALLSLLCLTQLILFWYFYPSISGYAPVSAAAISQVAMAFAFCSVLAFLYERIRTNQENQLKKLSERDFLTGALNRRGFIDVANAFLDEAHRFQQPCSVILFDLDYFKVVNDSHGHEAGDKLLQDVVLLAQQHLRQVDKLARWGGEEFIVVLPHTDLAGAHAWADKMRQAVASHKPAYARSATASFGVTTCMANDSLDDIVRRADEALYQAKQNGRNRVESKMGALSPMPLPA
jgi:diguanylate cyclase (GGDEF)-like protein